MSYTLQAFLGSSHVLRASEVPSATVLPLNDTLAILPLVEIVAGGCGIPSLPLTDEQLDALPAIARLGERLSTLGKVVYVEAEFFGGVGMQANCLFESGRLVSGPAIHERAINEALRFVGVAISGAVDEFDTVGLGRVRSTAQWLVTPNTSFERTREG
jgi:hypothetical protein